MHHEWHRDGFTVSTDMARLDMDAIYGYLSTSYWAQGIPRVVCERAIINAEAFGVYEGSRQVGFARVVTDYATVGYVGDVFVLEPWRGRGLSKFLMECILSHPELQGFRRWFLLTRDAHGLYAQHGFTPLSAPDRWMEKWTPNAYGVKE
ncbi:MAG: GNAT family N-acetyltransferase [Candidatus Eisenbacteria bacterium]